MPYFEVDVRNLEEVTKLFRETASAWINKYGTDQVNGNKEPVVVVSEQKKKQKDCIIC